MSEETVQAGRRRVAISHADRVVFPEAGLYDRDSPATTRRRARDGPACARPAARAPGLPQAHRGRGPLPQGRASALPRLDHHGGRAQARGRDDPPGAGGRRAHARLSRRPERDHPAMRGRAGPTARSSPTGSSSTSTPGGSPAPCAPPRAGSASCCDLGLEPFAMMTGSRGRVRGGPAAPDCPLRRGGTPSRATWPRRSWSATPRAHRRVPPRQARGPHLRRRPPQRLRAARRGALRGPRPAHRARRDAPALEEDDDGLQPQRWTVATIGERLGAGDPWRGSPASPRARSRAPRARAAALGEEAEHLAGEEVGAGVHRGVALARSRRRASRARRVDHPDRRLEHLLAVAALAAAAWGRRGPGTGRPERPGRGRPQPWGSCGRPPGAPSQAGAARMASICSGTRRPPRP